MTEELKIKIQNIVKRAKELKDKYTDQYNAPVNYVCIFCQNEVEFEELSKLAQKIGRVIKQTYSGPLFLIEPVETAAGKVRLLKIRKPDPTRPQQGDADFTVKDYQSFKEKYLKLPNFSLIKRPEFEMIELKDLDLDVLAYFSYPTLEESLGIK